MAYLGANSVSVFELGGTGRGESYDTLTILNGGSLTLNGTLDVQLLAGFVPDSGTIFDLIVGDEINDWFDYVMFPTVSGLTWQLDLLRDFHGSTTDYVRLTAASAVPLPGTVWLLGSALVGLVALSRRSGGSQVKAA
jgi:hypothetical protein